MGGIDPFRAEANVISGPPEHVDIFVVGVGVDEEGRLQLLGVGDGLALAIFGDVLAHRPSDVVGRRVEGAVSVRLIAHARDQVAGRQWLFSAFWP